MRDKIRFYLKAGTVFTIFFIMSFYAYCEADNIIQGPEITIEHPTNGTTINGETVIISGTAKNISYISVNGKPIFTDSGGKFIEKIILSKGYNSFFIEAKDRIGKEKTEKIEIIGETATGTPKDSFAQKSADKTI